MTSDWGVDFRPRRLLPLYENVVLDLRHPLRGALVRTTMGAGDALSGWWSRVIIYVFLSTAAGAPQSSGVLAISRITR